MQKPSPSPDMTAKLNRIKSALRESIEIAGKATEGPWNFNSQGCPNGGVTCYKIMEPGDFASSAAEVSEEDGDFISHARTMTPLACKALLLAIEGLESCQVYSPKGDDTAYDTLESITSTWSDA